MLKFQVQYNFVAMYAFGHLLWVLQNDHKMSILQVSNLWQEKCVPVILPKIYFFESINFMDCM